MHGPARAKAWRAKALPGIVPTLCLLATTLVAGLCAPRATAGETRITFDHLTAEDGLSANWVKAVLRDRRGFLWVGTQDGLDRYDGRSFVHYRHSPEDPHSLPGLEVGVLYEDRRGRLWVGTGWGSGGLALYDREQDRFVRLPRGPQARGLSGTNVFAILEDAAGRIWVGTENALDLVDPERGALESYKLEDVATAPTPTPRIQALAEDGRGGLWVGTAYGLVRFDPQSGKFAGRSGERHDPTGLDQASVLDLMRDTQGALWIGTSRSGLYRLDPASGRVGHFVPRAGDPTSLSHLRVRRLAQDRQGRIWVGTDNDGLNVLTPGGQGFRRYTPQLEDERSLNSASIHALHVDDQGLVWIGTYNGGLSFVSPFGPGFEHIQARRGGLSDAHVASILEDRAGDLWVGTDGGGLNRIDAVTGRYTHYQHDPRDVTSLAGNAVHTLLEDRAGLIWLGGWAAGLGRLDPKSGHVQRFRNDPADPRTIVGDNVWRILELSRGELLVATHQGTDLLDTRTGVFTRLWERYPDAGRGPTFVANHDARGNLWLGGLGAAQHVDRATSTVRTYRHDARDPQGLGRGTVAAILVDTRGNVWFGTEGGLSCLPAAADKLRRYTVADGLPHDRVTNILEDSHGNLWLTTSGGLSKLLDAVRVPEVPRFLSFDERDGLQGREFTRGACLKGRAGRLYFGGSRGLNAFFPDEIAQNPKPPALVLTDLRIFDRAPTPGGPGSPLARSITETRELTLSYADAVVTFEFAALNLVLPQKNRYSHMLEGIDRGWSPPSPQRSVTYTHLPPGSYVFRVRGSNNDGVWSENGLALALRVTPPFWRALWFQLLVGLTFAAGLVLAYRLRVSRIHAHARHLSSKVEERTRELHQLNAELEGRVAARTAELAAEKERLAVTLRSIGDGVIATDVTGSVLLLNRAAELLTGWTLHEALSRPLREVLPLLDRKTHQPLPDPVQAVLAAGSVTDLSTESLLLRRDGREVLVADSAAPIRDRGSQIVGVVLVLRDVTERRKVEEQLQTAQKLEALGILAGGIAHDFNNLLTGVFGYIDLAHRRSERPEAVRDVLSKALSVVRKARGLTGQLLTFSRMGEPVTAPLALAELLEGCARFALSGSNVSCEMQLPEGLWACQGDEQQIDQVIDNLLLNARQAMPEGGTIRLAAENLVVPESGTGPLQPGRYVRITIRDQGLGMSPQVRARIFEPFFTTKPHGTGLGLATTYSIVNKHGGHIEVESEPGAGATFSVYLPASRESTPDEQASARDTVPGQGRILVLDDEEYVRDVAQQALEDLGYAVTTVSNSEDAVQVFREAHNSSLPFGAVILDLTIPGGIGGLGVLSRLRLIDPAVRAIASSGYSSDTVMTEPEAHGFLDRLVKPYTAVELSEALSRTLRRPLPKGSG